MHPPRTPRQQDWPDGDVIKSFAHHLELAELCVLRLHDCTPTTPIAAPDRTGRWDAATHLVLCHARRRRPGPPPCRKHTAAHRQCRTTRPLDVAFTVVQPLELAEGTAGAVFIARDGRRPHRRPRPNQRRPSPPYCSQPHIGVRVVWWRTCPRSTDLRPTRSCQHRTRATITVDTGAPSLAGGGGVLRDGHWCSLGVATLPGASDQSATRAAPLCVAVNHLPRLVVDFTETRGSRGTQGLVVPEVLCPEGYCTGRGRRSVALALRAWT